MTDRPPMPEIYEYRGEKLALVTGWEFSEFFQGKTYEHINGYLGKATGWVLRDSQEQVSKIHVKRYDPNTLPAYQTNHPEYWHPSKIKEIKE